MVGGSVMLYRPLLQKRKEKNGLFKTISRTFLQIILSFTQYSKENGAMFIELILQLY